MASSNARMQLRGSIRMIKRHTETSAQELIRNIIRQCCHGWWDTQETFCPGLKHDDTDGTFQQLYGQRRHQVLSPFGNKVLPKPISSDPLH